MTESYTELSERTYIHPGVCVVYVWRMCIESSMIKTFVLLTKVFVLQEYKLAVIFINSKFET